MIYNFEGFKNGLKFLIMSIIVQLHRGESLEVKDNWVNLIVFIYDKKNSSKSIVRDINFYNKLSIEDLVHKNKYKDKCFLQKVKSIIVEVIKLPRNVLLDKTG